MSCYATHPITLFLNSLTALQILAIASYGCGLRLARELKNSVLGRVQLPFQGSIFCGRPAVGSSLDPPKPLCPERLHLHLQLRQADAVIANNGVGYGAALGWAGLLRDHGQHRCA
jgi:hypothetical protein